MFSEGQKLFALFFIIVFVAMLIWSYRKDLKLHKIHYKHAAIKVIISGILITLAFILIRIALQ